MGAAFTLVAEDVDTERAGEASQRIKEKNKPMKGMKGKRDRRCWIETLAQCVSTLENIPAKASAGVRCCSVISWMGLMNVGIETGCGDNGSVCVCTRVRGRFSTPRWWNCSF